MTLYSPGLAGASKVISHAMTGSSRPHASTCPPTSELWESSSSPASTSVHLALSAPFWVRMPSAMTHHPSLGVGCSACSLPAPVGPWSFNSSASSSELYACRRLTSTLIFACAPASTSAQFALIVSLGTLSPCLCHLAFISSRHSSSLWSHTPLTSMAMTSVTVSAALTQRFCRQYWNSMSAMVFTLCWSSESALCVLSCRLSSIFSQ
mmetsp:Transcript_26953/g.68355  ORF Transcript_26953/g.68355 Transcript_26953/m.68355 type:complete len:208 (-) Transcript_26953:27-650(-)